jgi:hypothetical protein
VVQRGCEREEAAGYMGEGGGKDGGRDDGSRMGLRAASESRRQKLSGERHESLINTRTAVLRQKTTSYPP